MTEITIAGQSYAIRQTIRAMFLYEEATKKAFRVESIYESYLFFYCTILACNKDCPLTWDEFIDACDNDASLAEQINAAVMQMQNRDEIFGEAADGDNKKKSQSKK